MTNLVILYMHFIRLVNTKVAYASPQWEPKSCLAHILQTNAFYFTKALINYLQNKQFFFSKLIFYSFGLYESFPVLRQGKDYRLRPTV